MPRSDALRSVELSRVLLEASSVLRHDLRNRLASIRNMAFFVGRRVKGSEPAQKDPRVEQFLASIESEVEQAGAMLDAWSERCTRVHEHRIQSVRAAQVVELAVDSARLDERVELRVSCEDSALDCDPLELALSLRCLIENAAEASAAGTVLLSAGPAGNHYRMSVRDCGPGFSEDSTDGGEPSNEKTGHLGLGLPIAKRIAVAAGGELRVTRVEEGGSEVALVIPLPSAGEKERVSAGGARANG